MADRVTILHMNEQAFSLVRLCFAVRLFWGLRGIGLSERINELPPTGCPCTGSIAHVRVPILSGGAPMPCFFASRRFAVASHCADWQPSVLSRAEDSLHRNLA